jgi:GNAT superfamily N-acetyltransferase
MARAQSPDLKIEPHLKIEPLGSHHDRLGFTCGVESLDRYFPAQPSQDVRRKADGLFVLINPREPNKVIGYYTLCAMSLPQDDVPVAACRHIPRYPMVSATLLRRLAVAAEHQGQGVGALLLADAVRRAYVSARSVGSSMLVVDAISEQAAAFYEAHGFVRLPESLCLVLPMRAIATLLTQ